MIMNSSDMKNKSLNTSVYSQEQEPSTTLEGKNKDEKMKAQKIFDKALSYMEKKTQHNPSMSKPSNWIIVWGLVKHDLEDNDSPNISDFQDYHSGLDDRAVKNTELPRVPDPYFLAEESDEKKTNFQKEQNHSIMLRYPRADHQRLWTRSKFLASTRKSLAKLPFSSQRSNSQRVVLKNDKGIPPPASHQSTGISQGVKKWRGIQNRVFSRKSSGSKRDPSEKLQRRPTSKNCPCPCHRRKVPLFTCLGSVMHRKNMKNIPRPDFEAMKRIRMSKPPETSGRPRLVGPTDSTLDPRYPPCDSSESSSGRRRRRQILEYQMFSGEMLRRRDRRRAAGYDSGDGLDLPGCDGGGGGDNTGELDSGGLDGGGAAGAILSVDPNSAPVDPGCSCFHVLNLCCGDDATLCDGLWQLISGCFKCLWDNVCCIDEQCINACCNMFCNEACWKCVFDCFCNEPCWRCVCECCCLGCGQCPS